MNLNKHLRTEDNMYLFVVGFFALGRTQNHEASPTQPSVQNVVGQATSPLTASIPGEDRFDDQTVN